MAGFMAGFGSAFQTQFNNRRERDWREDEAEKTREFQREERMAQIAARREESLIGLLAKQNLGYGGGGSGGSGGVSKAAEDVAWFQEVVQGADPELIEQYSTAVLNNPENATRMREAIDETARVFAENGLDGEAERIKGLRGDEALHFFKLMGPKSNPTPPVDLAAIVSGFQEADLNDPQQLLEQTQRVQEVGNRGGTGQTVEQVTYDTPYDSDVMNKMADDVIDLAVAEAQRDLQQAMSDGDSARANRIRGMIQGLDTEARGASVNDILRTYGPKVLYEVDIPGVEENFMLKPARTNYFSSEEEVQEALDNARIHPGDYYILNGELQQVPKPDGV